MDPARSHRDETGYVRRVLIAVGVVVAVAVLLAIAIRTWHALLTVFAGALIGVMLDGLARLVTRFTRAPRWLALTVTILALTGLLVGFWWWMGSALADQFEGVVDRARNAWISVKEALGRHVWGQRLLYELETASPSSEMAGRVGGVLTSTLGALGTALLIVLFGAYFAATPRIYLDNAMRVFPQHRRRRIRQVMHETGRALRSWLAGRFLSMTIVGIGTAIGLWIADVPMPVGLAFIAGGLSFVPNVGPIVAAVPGMLVGLSQDPMTAVWALVVYVAVQAIDNYLATPLINQRVVALPPAFLLAFQLLMGVSTGLIGLFMATPIAVALVVAIQVLYVHDVLGDQVTPLGKRSPDEADGEATEAD